MGEYISVNPWTSKELGTYEIAKADQIEEYINSSHLAFKQWHKRSLEERLAKVSEIKQNLESNFKHYALLITQEMGKLITESEAEILKCARLCDYYIESSEKHLEPVNQYSTNASSTIRYRPQGIILGVMPWNFPFWQVFRFAIPNLIIGNSVLIKHASNVGGSAHLLQRIFEVSGFGHGVFTNVHTGYSGVEQMISDPRIRGVSLTGSENAGRIVGALAGKYLKKSVLELGGNNAFLIMDDASIKKAAKAAVKARMVNAGQSCIASKRFLVPKSKESEFVSRLQDELTAFKVEDPILGTTKLAPLASNRMAQELKAQVEKSIEQGAHLIGSLKVEGACFEPCILTKVKPGNVAFEEELFGPVFSLTTYKSEAEVIEFINSSRFGLGVTLFGKNVERMEILADQLDEGSVFINSGVYSDPALPFGGTKNSGYGREMAKEGLLEFANIQPIVHPK